MSKGLEELKKIKDSLTIDGRIIEHTKEYKTVEKELDVLNDLIVFVKQASINRQDIISLYVLKNILKEVL